jgi:hypothetical protein
MCLLPPSGPNPALYVRTTTIPHEAAHILDSSTRLYKYSSSTEYINAVKADNSLNGEQWPSNYARNSFYDRVTERSEAAFSEDFAESARLYLNPDSPDGVRFRRLFPNRLRFIENLLGSI